jgi:hypothetical protein
MSYQAAQARRARRGHRGGRRTRRGQVQPDYLVQSGWQPTYKFTPAPRGAGAGQYLAAVTRQSGEDWGGALTLSQRGDTQRAARIEDGSRSHAAAGGRRKADRAASARGLTTRARPPRFRRRQPPRRANRLQPEEEMSGERINRARRSETDDILWSRRDECWQQRRRPSMAREGRRDLSPGNRLTVPSRATSR